MKAHKRLVHSLKDAAKFKKPEHPPVPRAEWLAGQPGSTRRGVARGNFVLPKYVV